MQVRKSVTDVHTHTHYAARPGWIVVPFKMDTSVTSGKPLVSWIH